MSSSRVVRGTKGRIILCICAVIVITGIIACYNNTLTQLDDVKKANKQCHQQQENLSTQLQVIFDYKQRLEKSLKIEKGEHQQTKKELENRIEEERKHNEKLLNDVNVKFASLQQHYNLLQTQYEDFKSESSKIQQKKIEQVNQLQERIKELESQSKQELHNKEATFQELKNEYSKLQVENIKLEKQLEGTFSSDHQNESERNHLLKQNHQLTRELDDLKAKCSLNQNLDLELETVNNVNPSQKEKKLDQSNVGENPNKEDLQNVEQPQENVNEDVLAAPNQEASQGNEKQLSSTNANINNIDKPSSPKSSLLSAQPLLLPVVPPSKEMNKASEFNPVNLRDDINVLPLPYSQKKIPAGVVPPPLPVPVENKENQKPSKNVKENPLDDINEPFPNRYMANLEAGNGIRPAEDKNAEPPKKIASVDNQINLKGDVGDVENNAIENVDSPLNDKQDVDQFALDYPNSNDKVNHKLENNFNRNEVQNNVNFKEGQNRNKVQQGKENGDYEKIVQNDMQLEEEAEDDDPDYAEHLDRPKEPAVRN